jgi:hypothetical protein
VFEEILPNMLQLSTDVFANCMYPSPRLSALELTRRSPSQMSSRSSSSKATSCRRPRWPTFSRAMFSSSRCRCTAAAWCRR